MAVDFVGRHTPAPPPVLAVEWDDVYATEINGKVTVGGTEFQARLSRNLATYGGHEEAFSIFAVTPFTDPKFEPGPDFSGIPLSDELRPLLGQSITINGHEAGIFREHYVPRLPVAVKTEPPEYDFSYQWVRVDADSKHTDIMGATGAQYTLGPDDLDRTILVLVSYTDERDYLATVASETAAPISAGNTGPEAKAVRGNPTIRGMPLLGETLVVDTSAIRDERPVYMDLPEYGVTGLQTRLSVENADDIFISVGGHTWQYWMDKMARGEA